jgi:beta-mannosidase
MKSILLTFFTLAGNNEDYALAESIPLELDYSVEYPEVDFRKTSFPARYIYEVLLPELVTKHAPDIHYHRGSPYSGSGKRSDDRKHGDIHQWNVWHVSDHISGSFVSVPDVL